MYVNLAANTGGFTPVNLGKLINDGSMVCDLHMKRRVMKSDLYNWRLPPEFSEI